MITSWSEFREHMEEQQAVEAAAQEDSEESADLDDAE